MNKIPNETKQESGRELQRLLRWIVDNPTGWDSILDPENVKPPMNVINEIINQLIDNGLYSVAYVALNTMGCSSREMELVLRRITGESLAEVAPETLMERIKDSLKYHMSQNQDAKRLRV